VRIKKIENTQSDSDQDPKAKMLAALAKKQKGQNSANHLGQLVVLRLVRAKLVDRHQKCIVGKQAPLKIIV